MSDSRIIMFNLAQYGIPAGAEGLAMACTWFERQKVTALIDPAAADIASMAGSMDADETVGVDGSLVHWMAVGWPEEWPGGRAPRWAPVHVRRATIGADE